MRLLTKTPVCRIPESALKAIWNLAELVISEAALVGTNNMKKTSRGAIVAASLMLAFVLVTPSFAHAATETPLNFTISGGFVGIGSQRLRESGGNLAGLEVAPGGTVIAIDLDSASLTYKIDASVQGPIVTGDAEFNIQGKTSTGSVLIQGEAQLNGMIPALLTVPGFLIGSANIEISSGCQSDSNGDSDSCQSDSNGNSDNCKSDSQDSDDCNSGSNENGDNDDDSNSNSQQSAAQPTDTKLSNVPMMFESAYLNPLGQPILFASMDPSNPISIVATYSKAVSTWKDVSVAGQVENVDIPGLPVGTPIGGFTMQMSLTEDLLKGTEKDQGTISLSVPPISPQSFSGKFKGTSMIPTTGGPDCSPLFAPLPAFPCTATGSTSTGTFSLKSDDAKSQVKGGYTISWTVPAAAFGMGIPLDPRLIPAPDKSTIKATLQPIDQNNGDGD
jgi:hypothetical protein